MTRDTGRSHDGGPAQHDPGDDALLAGLWENAPFARLPWDAPPELKELIEDIENPKRVYAIHRASRRHNFQLLVQKYIVQLRDGCGFSQCTTSTCFTCRKRIVGRAPIRRYSTTSARILAVYLASQDNAEGGLCPTLKPPKGTSAALRSIVFSPKHVPPSPRDDDNRAPTHKTKSQNGFARGVPPKERPNGVATGQRPPSHRERKDSLEKNKPEPPKSKTFEEKVESMGTTDLPRFDMKEKPVGKDYRSFAANMFGTVAFKMLEWLTPNSLEEMSGLARALQDDASSSSDKENNPRPSKQRTSSAAPRQQQPLAAQEPHVDAGNAATADEQKPNGTIPEPGEVQESGGETADSVSKSSPVARPKTRRRNSNARVRTSSTNKPKRQLPLDTPPAQNADEVLSSLKSPRLSGLQPDKTSRPLKTNTTTLARPISQLSTSGYFDDVALEKMPPPKPVDIKVKVGRDQLDGLASGDGETPKQKDTSRPAPLEQSASEQSSGVQDPESELDFENLLPQTLSRLNADLVDFLCDVLQEDHMTESHLFEPAHISKFHTRFSNQGKPLRRRAKAQRRQGSMNLRLEWRLFIEQSLFYVLSDPQALISSFTKQGQLYDSQTLWYCLLRMTRVAPSLVFHSLWMAAASLFAPPKTVQSLRSPTARLFPKSEKTLSNTEAGILMSICLHTLVAAAPLVSEVRQLYDLSRLRAHGLSLAGSGAVARQPEELCLQYEDAFTDDLTMRLARRAFAAITTRRYFDEMIENDITTDGELGDSPDILTPLFAQLDFLNMDAVYILNFSFSDRTVHETRVPTLLLDWARAVMLSDWDGLPEVPGDGPIGGALALIEAMYQKRHALLLTDAQFRSEYFAERLDDVQMPVSWLSFTSTKQKLHLLDFPYIFNPATLVSYFRSINFSRMSRSFEESSSLKNRMEHIVQPGGLIINSHHKTVLQNLLHTASSKYLILDIGRKTVIQDAFDQLWRRQERELMRPLKVHLGEDGGEEGFDSGGVQQEFFRLAIAEALNPDYGAFTVDDRTRMTWFQPGSIEPDWKFELVGLLISLAVFNGLTLPVTFPKALYRRLLGEPVTELHHIEDGWPDLASGLTTLLEWDEKDGAVEDVFARTYEFSVAMFGEPVSREMNTDKPEWPQFPKYAGQPPATASPPLSAANPPDAPLVTHENRNAYVSDYIHYLTDVSVRPQFDAFARGFATCLAPKSLGLLTPALLQSVVEGVQDIDVGELRRHARYVGWDASHRTVRDFWSVVRRYDDRMRRRLLEFVTASDRVPVGGMKNLQFVVQRNGEEGEGGHLPTAYTCYGTLLLPEYRDKEVLRERMAMALENAQGFGFA